MIFLCTEILTNHFGIRDVAPDGTNLVKKRWTTNSQGASQLQPAGGATVSVMHQLSKTAAALRDDGVLVFYLKLYNQRFSWRRNWLQVNQPAGPCALKLCRFNAWLCSTGPRSDSAENEWCQKKWMYKNLRAFDRMTRKTDLGKCLVAAPSVVEGLRMFLIHEPTFQKLMFH